MKLTRSIPLPPGERLCAGVDGAEWLLSRPALNDKQIARMTYRIALFRRRGLAEQQADRLADRLADRDFDRDDRRVCIECDGWQRGGTCFRAVREIERLSGIEDATERAAARVRSWAGGMGRAEVLPTTLQRCGGFQFQVP